MPEMIATGPIEYPPGKYHVKGDKFEVEAAHVKLLEINARAFLYPAEELKVEDHPVPETPRQKYQHNNKNRGR